MSQFRLAASFVALMALICAPVRAQTEPSEDGKPAVYVRSKKKARLVVFRVFGAPAPDAVWYEGPMGKFFLRDVEFAGYRLRREGLDTESNKTMYSPVQIPWDSDAAVVAVEKLVAGLQKSAAKQTADLECPARGAQFAARAARLRANQKALAAAEKLSPGSVNEANIILDVEGVVQAAKIANDLGLESCREKTPGGYRQAHTAFDAAQRTLE